MNAIFNVRSKDDQIISSFHIAFHERGKEKLQLDLKTFYLNYGEKIPEHNVEMEIQNTSPFSLQDLRDKGAHIHQGNDGRWYICYPKEVSLDKARELSIHWCMITTFHMKYQADIACFESFDLWMQEKRKTNKEASPFNEFAFWIHDIKGWKVEVTGSKMDAIISACSQELMSVLVLKQ